MSDQEKRRTVAGRLRHAVYAAGGNRAVAARAGVPLGTVNNYVSARTGMKMDALARMAAACNVPLEWLVTGEPSALAPTGSADLAPAAVSPREFSEPQAELAPPTRANTLDVAMLTKAIEIVAVIDGEAVLRDDPSVLAHRIAATYAVLMKPPSPRD